ncbi:MAG TPA: response regulator transcription factor [Microlunatus sp.]|nr:response regulator transcription factor [Microlunatus sp.]
MTVRILLVDDHPVVRAGLRAVLGTVDGMIIAGEASDGADALKEATILRPDVVLMDLQMRGMGGVEATGALRVRVPEAAVLVLTMYDDDDTVLTAMQAGARGYLVKGAAQADIVTAIRAVVAGQVVFGPGVANKVLDYFASGAAPGQASQPFPDLTERERAILSLLAEGHRTAAIADRLSLSPKTVSNQLTNVFAKLQVTNRSEAIVKARDSGLGLDR